MSRRTDVPVLLAAGLCGFAALLWLTTGSCRRPPMTATPTQLRCEYQSHPLGTDIASPRFSWKLADGRPGARQTAFQILVATTRGLLDKDKADVWDSGIISTDQSVNVPYGGPPLRSRTLYHWKVRVWDQEGRPSPWSEVASWETGLLAPDDWQARWIAAGEPGFVKGEVELAGKWIWHPREKGINKTVFFRRSFVLPSRSELDTMYISITADNVFTLYLNGEEIGRGANWREVKHYDVHLQVREGKNVLAVAAANTGGDICGLIVNFHAKTKDGSVIQVYSDASWKTADSEAPNWTGIEFDDAGWESAVEVAEYGSPPWGKFGGEYVPPRAQMVRKEFDLEKTVKRARVYVTGLGSYRLFLNGRRVGNDVFTPGWTDYRFRVEYQTYDVTDLVRRGRNAAAALLGNAWWCGELGWEMRPQYSMGPLRFLMQLEVEYDDGSRQVIVTDSSWKCHDAPILYNGLYNGETYDARLEQPGWTEPGFDDSSWKPVVPLDEGFAALVADQAEPVRAIEERQPVSITEPKPGVFVFDMGQNFSGWARLRVKGPAGTQVTMRFGEVLNPDGTVYVENYRRAKATDTYILKGKGTEVWEPTFTFRGYRYVQVTGYPGRPGRDALTGVVVHSDLTRIGDFSCSEELLNQIHRNVVWGLRSNFLSIPTDCPQRDERLGWTGDAQIIAPTACYNLHMARFFAKWLRDLASSQDEQGAVRDVAPAAVVGQSPASPAWGDAIILVPWVLYEMYGETRIIEEIYPNMVRWFEFMLRNSQNYLYEREGYGDWVAVIPSPKKPIAGAYFYLDAVLLSKMAAVLGKSEDAERFADLAAKIRAAFNARYLRPDSAWYLGATQTANVLPLAFGLAPEERAHELASAIARDVAARDYHLTTGFLGTAYLLPVLCDYGFEETAFRLATQRSFPSWGYMIEKGATTIWELWDSDVQGPGMNSRNHYALGAVDRWFFEYVGGIRPAEPGFKRAVVWPRMTKFLQWARVTHETEYGLLACHWRRAASLEMDVTIPPNTSAEVRVPVEDPARATVYEGKTLLIREGQKVADAPYVQFVKLEGNCVVFDVKAGTYHFRAE
ncbi:MAG: family 78 glycoside hydrolase catalytic domain [candidate division KSB1 bacterium]|nr:family 78 glycoside hydrolase catalytic domain [candidate division KSB1 bacterium]